VVVWASPGVVAVGAVKDVCAKELMVVTIIVVPCGCVVVVSPMRKGAFVGFPVTKIRSTSERRSLVCITVDL